MSACGQYVLFIIWPVSAIQHWLSSIISVWENFVTERVRWVIITIALGPIVTQFPHKCRNGLPFFFLSTKTDTDWRIRTSVNINIIDIVCGSYGISIINVCFEVTLATLWEMDQNVVLNLRLITLDETISNTMFYWTQPLYLYVVYIKWQSWWQLNCHQYCTSLS